MNQSALDFESAPRARRRDPSTSHAAAASAKQLQADHQEVIYQALKVHGPMGKDAIAACTGLNSTQVCRRTVELQRSGLIEPTGGTVLSAAGRAEREWRAV